MANNQTDASFVMNEEKVNVSVSSSSSNDSQGFANQKKLHSKSSLFRRGSNAKMEKKRQKKWKKNKIGKEDFYGKTTEFRCWLKEKKDMDLDLMDKANAKAMFKKFVKHWNKKKLDEKYYNNLGVWAATSPSVYSKFSAPEVSEEKAKEKVKAETFTPLYDQDFSTFGKRVGKKALRELQRMEGGTPTRPEEPIYAVPEHKNSQDETRDEADITPPGYDSPIPPRPALSTLFANLESSGESESSEHSFASVRRQRPMSCHGRVQKVTKEPLVPVVPPISGVEDNSKPVEMRCPTARPPRPQTDIYGSTFKTSVLRTKVKSTTSTSSTESEASSGSFSSSVSSLSSYAPSTASEADYASSYGSRTSLSVHRDPSFRPQPPPRSSSISKQSKKLREVAKAVIAKQSASPMKPETPLNERRMPFKSGITACEMETPSPPPPPPPVSEPSLLDGDASMILPPPPEFASDGMSVTSPPLPPPPAFAIERELKESTSQRGSGGSSGSESDSVFKVHVHPETPQLPPQVLKKVLSFPQSSTPQHQLQPVLKRQRPPTAPKPVQESAVHEVLPSPIVVTKHRLTTPAPAPKSGPSLCRDTPRPISFSTQKHEKRSSDESVDYGVTAAKKIDLDISYKSSCV